MRDSFFWKSWPTVDKKIYQFLLLAFAVVGFLYLLAILKGEDNALEWYITSKADTISIPIKEIQVGLFEFELKADNYLINQFYEGSAHQITPTGAYVFLGVFMLCLVFILAIVTYLSRFWYLITMGVVSFGLVTFRFEQLEILGWIDNTFLILVLVIILSVSYYIHTSGQRLTFGMRWLGFSLCMIVFGVLIALFSSQNYPFYFLANYNFIAPVVLSILFIFLVAHEIIFLILYLVSSVGLGSGSNLRHFIILSLIYLANLLLVYFRNAFIIDWNILYLNAFILLIASAIIGIWGFREREVKYGNILPFQPFGGYLYLVLGIICFSTLHYHISTLNDPVLETFEDAIVYSHIGFGIMFFLYLLSNFIDLIRKNLKVFKVAFKEDNMPYFSANIAGLVIVAAFYYLSNQAALQQAFAGYYNGIASVYQFEEDRFLATEYYKRGAIFGFNNHRSNYSLGELYLSDGESSKAISSLKKAIIKNPTEFAYINLAKAQENNYQFFDAVFTLQAGIKAFPESERIRNNLGLMFKSTDMLDSAIIYMESGSQGDWGNRTNLTNIIDVLARNRVALPEDSLSQLYKDIDHLPFRTNMRAYSNTTGNWLSANEIPMNNDSILDLHEFAALYNHSFGDVMSNEQTPGLAELLQKLAVQQANGLFVRDLQFASALLQYASEDYTGFFRTMDRIQDDPVNKGYYNHIQGIIALELGAPNRAVEFFQYAADEGYEAALENLAISLMEANRTSEAVLLWNDLLSQDSLSIANDMLLTSMSSPVAVLQGNSDGLKYSWIRYHSPTITENQLNQILESIEAQSFKEESLISVIEMNLERGDLDRASQFLQKLNEMEIESERAKKIKYRFQLAQVADGVDINSVPDGEIRRRWLESPDGTNLEYFYELGMKNPFDEAILVIAANYVNEVAHDKDKAYEVLLNAVEMNSFSPTVKKAYILQSIQMGLSSYIELEMQELERLMTPQQFRAFRQKVDQAILDFESNPFPTSGD